MKSARPAPSSLRRRRPTFTVSVFSSTKLSVFQRLSISSSRLTTPRLSISVFRMRSSFFVSSTLPPGAESVPADMSSSAPPRSRTCFGSLRP